MELGPIWQKGKYFPDKNSGSLPIKCGVLLQMANQSARIQKRPVSDRNCSQMKMKSYLIHVEQWLIFAHDFF